MRKKITVILLTSLFIGCGGGGNNSDEIQNDPNSDTILKQGESITCSEVTSFSVIPTQEPSIQFSKNTENGEVTISIDKDSKGFVILKQCTQI